MRECVFEEDGAEFASVVGAVCCADLARDCLDEAT